MHPDLVSMTERVTRLRGCAVDGEPSEKLLCAIEDMLAEGYARALTGDAWSMRAEQRMRVLLSGTLVPIRGGGLRELGAEHASCQRELTALRRELAALRLDRARLQARSRTMSS